MNPDIAAQLIKSALSTTTDDSVRLAQLQVYADNFVRALDAVGLLAYATGPQEAQRDHTTAVNHGLGSWAGQRSRARTLEEQRAYLREVAELPGNHPVEGDLGDVPR